MSIKWTKKHIDDLLKAGKIRSYVMHEPKKEPATGGRKIGKHFKKRDPIKDWIAWNLLFWCQERKLDLQEEYRFHPERKWRLDHAIEALKIGIEYEGLMSEKSRHTTASGYTADTEKYNAAQALGWKVIRFTALNYKDLITELNKHI